MGRLIFHRMGRGVRFEGWIDVPQRGGRIILGDQAYLCRFVQFSVPAGGELHVGEMVFIGQGTVISAHRRVAIGDHPMLAEYVSIHDNDHRTEPGGPPFAQQGFVSKPLEIGANCWIGAKAVLVRGSGMGDNSILGAGAVLTRHITAGAVAVGVPAKPLARPALVK
jgi:acetyltransferase-like isoleucine patch superfamily enzyme